VPDVNSIPFRQANGNGHYESKQLPNDNQDFLAILGLPISLGNVTSVTTPSRDGQLATYWQTGGLTIKGSTAIGVVDLVDGVVTTRLSPAGDIVGTLGAQTLNNKTLTNCVLTSPSGLTKADVGLGNVDNTSDVNKPVSTATQLQLDLKESLANKNVANGYAGLDAGGKVLASQLPTTVQGTVNYQGTWNATTNSPAIPAASAGNKGWYYVVSVAGTVPISGVSSWDVGDWLVSNGTSWDKIDNTDAVTSVSGRTGAVVLAKADVGLSNVDNTSDDAKNSASAVLTNKTISGQNNTLTVRLDQDVANNLPTNRLNNGIGATSQTWWCGDGQWKAPAGAGDVVGPAGAADGEVALFSLATGKLLKRATGSGIVNVVNGIYQAPVTGNSTISANVVVGDTVQSGNPTNSVIVPSFANHPDKILSGGGSALDDHFDGSVLDAKWTQAQTASILNPLYRVAGSKLSLGGQSPSTSDGVLYQNYVTTPLPNTNDFTVTVRLDAKVLVRNTTTGSNAYVDIRLYNNTSGLGAALRFYYAYVTAAATTLQAMIGQGGVSVGTAVLNFLCSEFPEYVRMSYTSSTRATAIQFSGDGNSFQTFGTLSAAQSGFTAGALPQVLVLVTSFSNNALGAVHFDWVKFTNP
jgi:hypothetical protein